jgi:purine-binding chemotaxis protein CheW
MKEGGAKSESKSEAIDWDRIRSRIDSARQVLERGMNAGPEEKKRVLRERAKTLARAPERQREARQYLDVVEFGIAEETYAIEAASVLEVVPLADLTPLPGVPAFVSGIAMARGRVVTVVDIKKLFGIPEKGLADLHRIVIVGGEGAEIGILSDGVTGIRAIPVEEIGPPLPSFSGVGAEYLRGVTGESLVVLDAAKMLRDPRIAGRAENGR